MAVSKSFSGKDVNRAGQLLKNINELSEEDLDWMLDVVSFWRFSHDEPLDSAFEKLKVAVARKDPKAIFAKRRKRYVSILRKLQRFETMQLKTMQDIGGCRAVVANEKKLRQSVRELKRLKEFKFKDGYRFKDYIDRPKADGYRGYHLIGQFKDSAGDSKRIEVQLRTRVQHAWATALEIVDLFTGQALKSNQGEDDWTSFFEEASMQFSAIESIHLFQSIDPRQRNYRYLQIVDDDPALKASRARLKRLAKSLNVRRRLEAYSGSIKVLDEQLQDNLAESGYVLVQIQPAKLEVQLEGYSQSDSEAAEAAYLQAEKKAAKNRQSIVALVSSSSIGGIKDAYPNYFADSSMFASLIDFTINARY